MAEETERAPSTPEQFKTDYKTLHEVPSDVLASRIVAGLILCKGNLNQYSTTLERFIMKYRSEAGEGPLEHVHVWKTISVQNGWFTECETCKIGAPLSLQAESAKGEGPSAGTPEQQQPFLNELAVAIEKLRTAEAGFEKWNAACEGIAKLLRTGWPFIPGVAGADTPTGPPLDHSQKKLVAWGTECFGAEHMADHKVRALRLLEEAIEFAQAVDAPLDQCSKLVDYVYSRPAGSPKQELGGVGVTWLVAAAALGESAAQALQSEMTRIAREAYNKLHDHVYGNGRIPTLSVPPQPTDVDMALCNYINQQRESERSLREQLHDRKEGQ